MVEATHELLGKGTCEVLKLPMLRRAMIRASVRSAAAPYFSLRRGANVTKLLSRRASLRAAGQEIPSINDYVVRAVGLALRDHPVVNAGFIEEEVIEFSRVNVGVAIAVPGGLVAPAVYDVDLKDALHVGRDIRLLAEQAKTRSLSRESLQDPTFTVSNLGMFGIEDFDPLLNAPQAAILGVGAVTGEQEKRMRVSLGCDHRVITGAEGAEFLQTFCDLLENGDDENPLFWSEV